MAFALGGVRVGASLPGAALEQQGQVVGGQADLDVAQLGLQRLVLVGRLGLALQGAQLAAQLAQDGLELVDVLVDVSRACAAPARGGGGA